MLKYIDYQLNSDETVQLQLEKTVALQIQERFKNNIRAFSSNIPSVIPLINQHTTQKYSVFCNSSSELNIVDFATGRVWYGLSPKSEIVSEVESFCNQAPFINMLSSKNASCFKEAMPESVDLVLMFGLGLGYQINELLLNRQIKYLVVYEPDLDLLNCSMQANDWELLFDIASACGTQLFLQLGSDGLSVFEDLAELLQVQPLDKVYIYKHRFHPVMDKVIERLFEASGDTRALTNPHYHILPYDSFYDSVSERAGNVLANRDYEEIHFENELYKKNIDALKHYYPSIYKEILKHKATHWALVKDDNGQENLLHLTRKGLFYNHLRNDSEMLIQSFISSPLKDDVILGQKLSYKFHSYHHDTYVRKLKDYVSTVIKEKGSFPSIVESLIIFGIGLGKHIEILLSKHQVKSLYICEPNLDFFYHSLFITDWDSIFRKAEDAGHRIYLNLGGDGSEYFIDLMKQFYIVGAHSIANTYMLSSYYNPDMQKAIFDLRSQLRVVLSLGEYFDHVKYGIAHTHYSVEHHSFLKASWSSQFKQNLEELPVFIVGNGPSLDSCFEYLHEHRDKVLLISCGTALKALHRNGLQPDFHAEVEQNRATFDWVSQVNDPQYLKAINLISVNGIHPDTANLFKHTYLAFKDGESSSYVFQKGLKKYFPDVNLTSLSYAYPTVTNLVVNYMLSAGFKLFYLFGVDLGYVDISKHHSQYSAYFKSDGKEVYNYQEAHGGGIPCIGNFRDIVFTKPEFEVSRKLLEQALAKASNGIEVYNCSNGAKIAGAVPLSPENILLPSLGKDIGQLISEFLNAAYHEPFEGASESIYGQFDLQLLERTVQTLIDDLNPVYSRNDAQNLIDKQWKIIQMSVLNQQDLTFYLFYGSANYVLGILTKLMSSIDNEKSEYLDAFNEVVEIWRGYLMDGLALYLNYSLNYDSVTAKAFFN